MQRKVRASVDAYRHVVGLANRGLDVDVCLTELIDNALDAGATDVSVEVVAGKRLCVRDNGVGIPCLDDLVRFGGHTEHASTGSGVYGVGMKEASLVLGGERSRVSVRTVRKADQTMVAAQINWQELRESEECMTVSDPIHMPDEPHGTEIVVEPLRVRFPDGERRAKLLDQLGYIYSPALKRGVKIRVTVSGKTFDLPRWQLPKFAESIDCRVELGPSKIARVHAGIIAPGEALRPSRQGLTYTHKWRVVKRGSRDGCGDYGTHRFCGFVEVVKGWRRTTNKTDLVDADDLYEEISRLTEPLLKKLAVESHRIELEGSRLAIEEMLRAAIVGPKDEKAKRSPPTGSSPGTKEPTGNGGKHKDAKARQPGTTFGRSRVTSIRLRLDPGYDDDGPIGKWEPGKTAIITLFEDHPLVARISKPWNGDAIFALAMAVVAACKNSDGSGQVCSVTDAEVLASLATYTKLAARLDGTNLLAQAAE